MAKDVTPSDTMMQSANVTIQCEAKWKCKAYTTLTAEQRATIGKYASEHGNLGSVKKFKEDKSE